MLKKDVLMSEKTRKIGQNSGLLRVYLPLKMGILFGFKVCLPSRKQ